MADADIIQELAVGGKSQLNYSRRVRFYAECLRNGSGILHLTQQDVSRDAQTTHQGADHFEAEASAP